MFGLLYNQKCCSELPVLMWWVVRGYSMSLLWSCLWAWGATCQINSGWNVNEDIPVPRLSFRRLCRLSGLMKGLINLSTGRWLHTLPRPPHLCLWKEIEVGEEMIIMEKEHLNMMTTLLCTSNVILACWQPIHWHKRKMTTHLSRFVCGPTLMLMSVSNCKLKERGRFGESTPSQPLFAHGVELTPCFQLLTCWGLVDKMYKSHDR